MNVILLFPGISGCGFNSYGKKMDESWINHGLCSIAAYAKKEGFFVDLIDLRYLKNWKHFKTIISKKKPDVMGITMMSVDYNPAMKSIEIIKKVTPKTVIVVGGPHPTLMLDELKKVETIDHIITGEGEISFTELLKNIEKGKDSPKVIKGKISEDLDSLPFIDRELFGNFEYPPNIKGFESPFVTVIAGRGCKYNCNFCQPAERILFGRKVRRRSPENVINELKLLREKYNFKSMMIHDDCITEDTRWIIKFCRLFPSVEALHRRES